MGLGLTLVPVEGRSSSSDDSNSEEEGISFIILDLCLFVYKKTFFSGRKEQDLGTIIWN